MKRIEVALVPQLYSLSHPREPFIVVLIDILRATTSVCAALHNGVRAIIPVATLEEARVYKERGFMVAAEREGIKPDFADMGNSAFNFMTPQVVGREIVYSTTNGTQAFELVKNEADIALGAFVNLSALAEWLMSIDKHVLMLCSGWKGHFNLEDTVFAGALADKLLASGRFEIKSDASHAAIDLWSLARNDLMGYLAKAEHRERLRRLGLDDVLEFTFTIDACPVVPLGRKGIIKRAEDFE
ncbi:MAG: 2-phosphosulfolactate phosphatase [Bacteroidales bacterium]|nr:2-phosphosulfolactate phosphatase [Bacteroidales bacterium]